jgi:hypothetical protein
MKVNAELPTKDCLNGWKKTSDPMMKTILGDMKEGEVLYDMGAGGKGVLLLWVRVDGKYWRKRL